MGFHPIVTFQYHSTTLYQVSYHIQYLFFQSDNRMLPYRRTSQPDRPLRRHLSRVEPGQVLDAVDLG
jgi:hypothetical protein